VLIRLAQTDAASLRSAEAYMFQIAANLLRDRARRDKVRADYREQKLRSDQGMFDPLDPFRVVSGRLNLATVGAAIASLPERPEGSSCCTGSNMSTSRPSPKASAAPRAPWKCISSRRFRAC
jgi:hypothetical protein